MTGIIGCAFLFCAVIVAILIASFLVFFLFSEYPVRTNLVIIIFLLILGVPILYIPVIYFVAIALICAVVGFLVWIFPLDESKNAIEELESSSKEEAKIDIENNTTIETKTPVNSIFIEEPNNIYHNINYTFHPGIVFLSPPIFFNSNHNQDREPVDSEAFKEHNSPQVYDSDNYQDDDLCLKQEYIITFPVTKIVEPSRLVALEIDAPDLIFLKPSQEQVFTVHGIDQFGVYIDPGRILWRATGGAIDSQGKLIVENDAKGSFQVTAISSNAKVSQHRLRQNLLLIKISLKIFSWVLSHKKFVKDTASYFIQEFYDSEVLVNEIFPGIDTSNIDGFLTILIFDDIKERVVEAAINIIINYLEKFITLCFKEESSMLTYSVNYVVLPELRKLIINPSDINIKPGKSINFHLIGIDQKGDKIEIERKVSWKATGGRIDRKGKLTVNSNSQGIFSVTAIVGNRLNISICYNAFHSQESFEVTAVVDNKSTTSSDCNMLQDTSGNIPSSGGITIASYNKELREREIGKNHYRHTKK